MDCPHALHNLKSIMKHLFTLAVAGPKPFTRISKIVTHQLRHDTLLTLKEFNKYFKGTWVVPKVLHTDY